MTVFVHDAPGTSPRVRGKPSSTACKSRGNGYIPACAGEASVAAIQASAREVHPRVCGGSLERLHLGAERRGTSPRVRGKRPHVNAGRRTQRYIPACAGEAVQIRKEIFLVQVHPRVCGGSRLGGLVPRLFDGTSPRVRGKPGMKTRRATTLRYIPACAGEARGLRYRNRPVRVHPRVCGGSAGRQRRPDQARGTSPRVRGKRARVMIRMLYEGYIPACAGEAAADVRAVPGRQVHPRVCGGSELRA